jgi:5'-deoxynucleotidase YfbR-like HD superfamily hydrolase
MEPVDTADPRKPYIQIAASIRAAILSGELEPGAPLQTGQELADFFGVSRMTVVSALRVLREEGFIRSQPGGKVRVRDRAVLPSTGGDEHPLGGIATYLYELGHLKRVTRAGWLLLGIPDPETVAEHSFRVGAVGIALAALEGADIGRVAAMGVLHDGHEARLGDVPSVGRAYITSQRPEVISANQTADMPDPVAKVFQDLVAEFEAAETIEAKVARDADKLETLLQAAEYAALGHDTEPWQETSVGSLRTDSARQLAEAILTGSPHGWWRPFAASYQELRAAAQARARRQQPPPNQ